MLRCCTCQNLYEEGIEIAYQGEKYGFDCFECAVHMLAPLCKNCGCRVIGHGVDVHGQRYCCLACVQEMWRLEVDSEIHFLSTKPASRRHSLCWKEVFEPDVRA